MTLTQSGPILVTAASSDPVTLAETKTYCNVSGTGSDGKITEFIASATEYVQKCVGQQFIQATLKQVWDDFCSWSLRLDRQPLVSVSHVKYYDVNGTQTTISSSNYWAAVYARPPCVVPTYSYVWPVTQLGRPEAVEVQYIAGYASAATVPRPIKTGIMALVKHWYDNPGIEVTTGAVPKPFGHSLDAILALYDRGGYG